MTKQVKPLTPITNTVAPALKIKSVQFCQNAMVNFVLVDRISDDKFDISLVENLLFYKDKASNTKYISPLSNVASMVINNE